MSLKNCTLFETQIWDFNFSVWLVLKPEMAPECSQGSLPHILAIFPHKSWNVQADSASVTVESKSTG